MSELYDVLQQWWNGGVSPEHMLWVLSIRWWARIGKVMVFFSAATIITEIIGDDKLKRYGDSLRVTVTREHVVHHIKSSLLWLGYKILELHYQQAYKATWSKSPDNEQKKKRLEHIQERRRNATEKARQHSENRVVLPVTLLLTIGLILWIWNYRPSIPIFPQLMLILAAFVCNYALVGPVIIALGRILTWAFLAFIDYVIVEPIALVAQLASQQKIINVANFTLLVIGSFFDMLAS